MASYGIYPIEGVVFKEGVTYTKMVGREVPFDVLGEVTDYKFSLGSNSSIGGDSEKPEADNKPTESDAKPEEKPRA